MIFIAHAITNSHGEFGDKDFGVVFRNVGVLHGLQQKQIRDRDVRGGAFPQFGITHGALQAGISTI